MGLSGFGYLLLPAAITQGHATGGCIMRRNCIIIPFGGCSASLRSEFYCMFGFRLDSPLITQRPLRRPNLNVLWAVFCRGTHTSSMPCVQQQKLPR